jgi:hypothetical protein
MCVGAQEMTYAIPVFYQHVVVSANGHEEEHDLDVVKYVNPLLPL